MANAIDIDTYDDPYANAVDEAVEEINEEEEIIENMSEVEVRLEEANYLKALLQSPLFDNPDSEIAKRVERRVRGFIQTELKVLLGLETAKVEVVQVKSSFSEEEEKVLKALANRVLSKEKPEVKSEPVVNRTVIEKPVQVKPAATTVAPKVYRAIAPISKPLPAKKPKTKRNIVEKEMTINGVTSVRKIDTTSAVRPESYKPMTSEEVNASYMQNGFSNTPNSGIIGMALQAINPALMGQLIIDDDGDTR